jgi:hypothetical protein
MIVEDAKEEIHSLLEQAYSGRINNLKSSITLAEKALEISRNIGDDDLSGKSLSQLALFHMITGEHEKAMQFSLEAIEYFKELGDEKGIADAQYNIAGIHYKTNNFHLGLLYLIDCLSVYRKFKDYHNEARVQKSLGTIFEYIGDQRNAIRAYESSVEAGQNANDLNLISNAYNPLSGIYLKNRDIKKAMELITESIAIKQTTGDIRGLAFALYGRGKVYAAMKKYDEAEHDYEKALTIHQEMGDHLGISMAYRKMGILHKEKGQTEEAKTALLCALKVSNDYNIAVILFKVNYLLYELYRDEENYPIALTYLEHYVYQKETVINANTMQVIENYELISKKAALEKEALMEQEKAEIVRKKDMAEQAFKVRQEFLSTMSHEIRTPLNAVITISSLLNDKSGGEEEQLISSLKFAANNLLLIINDILDFTKLDSGKAKLELRPANLPLLLNNIKSTYEPLAKEKGLNLQLHVNSAIDSYYDLDETKLSQILGNLVSNAVKFTEQGSISIIVDKKISRGETDEISFIVKDTGNGIGEQYLVKIFDSFFQPLSVTTRKQGGSGLGLAIVKQLVELYGSDIHVSSELNKGSEFYFNLKLKRVAEPAITSGVKLNELKDKNVLIAEDNMINATVLAKLLSKWGMTSVHVKNGLEAVAKSEERAFDYILMDIHMPNMNGFDATRQIRCGGNPNSAVPIFALTADITAQHLDEYETLFTGFLNKPLEIEKLYEALVKAGH